MKVAIVLAVMICLMPNYAFSDSGLWFGYGPGTLVCEPSGQSGPDGPAQVICFKPDKNHPGEYWCGAGVEFDIPTDANQLEFHVKTNQSRNLGLKIHDSKGQAGQYHFDAEEEWVKVQFRRESPEWLYNPASGPLANIKKFDIILNNRDFAPGEVFNIWISGVKAVKILPKPFLFPNWKPDKTPPPVKGYRVETCIHNCWRDPAVGDFTAHGCAADADLGRVKEIMENLIREYGPMGFTIGYPQGENGKAYAEFALSKGAIPMGETHNNPGLPDARSVNWVGEFCPPSDGHSEDMTNPLVLAAVQKKFLEPARIGIKAMRSVDYVWPWSGGAIWGYSVSAVKRWRENLNEQDTGLEIIDGNKKRIAKFWEYFESYHGYRMKPEDVGLRTWEGYYPPPPGMAPSPALINNQILFSLLFHYEWVKFINEAFRPAAQRYGCLAQPTLNPEFHNNGTDLYWFLRLTNVRGFCTEWWAGVECILPTYYAGRYFDNVAKKNDKEIVLLGETGANGNGFMTRPNYWDNMSAFLVNYAQAASVDARACHDQYWGASWKRMTDPKEKAYRAYCSFRSTWCGFLQCRNDRAIKPKTDVLAIVQRPVAGGGDSFDRQYPWQSFSLGSRLAGLNYLHDGGAFPLDEAMNLDDYSTILYSPSNPPRGFAAKLARWLAIKPGRTLITHSFVPTHFSAPCRDLKENPGLLQPGGQEKVLAFQTISEGKIQAGILKAPDPVFAGCLKEFLGRSIRFSRPICQTSGGKSLVLLGDTPLVSEHGCGKGRVVYLHLYPDNTKVTSRRVELAIIDAAMRYAGYKPAALAPENEYVMAFDRPSGAKAFILYNLAARTDMTYEGKNWNVYQARDPEVKGRADVLVGLPNRKYRITNIITGEISTAVSNAESYLPVSYDGWNLFGIYVDESR